jgi:hypothetical protein
LPIKWCCGDWTFCQPKNLSTKHFVNQTFNQPNFSLSKQVIDWSILSTKTFSNLSIKWFSTKSHRRSTRWSKLSTIKARSYKTFFVEIYFNIGVTSIKTLNALINCFHKLNRKRFLRLSQLKQILIKLLSCKLSFYSLFSKLCRFRGIC